MHVIISAYKYMTLELFSKSYFQNIIIRIRILIGTNVIGDGLKTCCIKRILFYGF